MGGIHVRDGELFARNEVRLWLYSQERIADKEKTMMEDSVQELEWKELSEDDRLRITEESNKRETEFEKYIWYSQENRSRTKAVFCCGAPDLRNHLQNLWSATRCKSPRIICRGMRWKRMRSAGLGAGKAMGKHIIKYLCCLMVGVVSLILQKSGLYAFYSVISSYIAKFFV